MQTIAECVGGACDGVQLDPPDPGEPDDWPDHLKIEAIDSKKTEEYELRAGKPKVRGCFRVYFYDVLP